MATSWGFNSRARRASCANTATSAAFAFAFAFARSRASSFAPIVARLQAALERPWGVQAAAAAARGPRVVSEAEASLARLRAMASQRVRTRGRSSRAPSLAAPHAAFASSCALNLSAWIRDADSTASASRRVAADAEGGSDADPPPPGASRTSRFDASDDDARWSTRRPSLPQACRMLASWRDSTWRAWRATRDAAASRREATRASPRARRPSGARARRPSAVPQFTTLNSPTDAPTSASTSDASEHRARPRFSSTWRWLIVAGSASPEPNPLRERHRTRGTRARGGRHAPPPPPTMRGRRAKTNAPGGGGFFHRCSSIERRLVAARSAARQ